MKQICGKINLKIKINIYLSENTATPSISHLMIYVCFDKEFFFFLSNYTGKKIWRQIFIQTKKYRHIHLNLFVFQNVEYKQAMD